MTAQHQQHPLASKSGVIFALPQSFNGLGLQKSSIPFPCFDEFVKLENPASVFWIEKCNEQQIASIRILMRGTISNATVSRQFHISPSSPDVGFFLVASLLTLMEDIVSLRTSIPTKENFNDMTCQMMRGLFGQLLTVLASGSNPLSMSWQLVMSNPNIELPPENHWWIYSRMAHLFQYTGWDTTNLLNNIKLLISRIVRKKIVDPYTEPMRKNMSEINQKKFEDSLEKKNLELDFLSIAVETVKHIQTNKPDKETVKQISTRMLESIPHDNGSNGYELVVQYLKVLQADGETTEAHHQNVMVAATNIFTKRSGMFKKAKNALLNTVDKQNEEKIKEIAVKMDDKINELETEWLHNPIKVQGFDAHHIKEAKSGTVELEDRNLLSSDAERNRIAWKVKGSAVSMDKDRVLSYVLSGVMPDELVTFTDQEKKKEDKSLLTEFKLIPKSHGAIKLLETLPTESCLTIVDKSKIPLHEFMKLSSMIGCKNDEEYNNKIRKMIELYLEAWKNPIEVENKAKHILDQ
jgi:hypothetical protein